MHFLPNLNALIEHKQVSRGLESKRQERLYVRSVLGKYWSRPFFASLWTTPSARSINLQKKNSTNIFPIRTSR